MRVITTAQIATFAGLSSAALLGAGSTGTLLATHLPPSDYRSILSTFSFIILAYIWLLVVYRAFFGLFPLITGELSVGSSAEFRAQVNILFFLLFFNSLIRTNFLPVPLMRLIYQALGTRFGRNSYSAGALLDPSLTSFGDNCIVGHNAVIFAHAIEGQYFALDPVVAGNNVTIGAMAIVMSGVTIEDDAIVSAGALVRKGTRIGRGEIWGGVPARCIGRRGSQTEPSVKMQNSLPIGGGNHED